VNAYPLFVPLARPESIKHAEPAAGTAGGTQLADAPPSLRDGKSAENPIGNVVEYMISEVMIVRMDEIAEASFALMRERIRFGIATAAMTKIMATTISSSMSENPFCFRPIAIKLRDISSVFNNTIAQHAAYPLDYLQFLAHSYGDAKTRIISELLEFHYSSLPQSVIDNDTNCPSKTHSRTLPCIPQARVPHIDTKELAR
jgi:hypothetical protein